MIQIYTPTSILACVTDDEGVPIDCFADAIPDANPYKDTLSSMLWARYRYSMINSVCLDRWLQRVKDTALLIDQRYQLLIAEFETQKEKLASIKRDGYSETYHDKSVSTPSGSDTTVTDHDNETTGTTSDSAVTEQEDLPQSADSSGTKWLSGRTTGTNEGNTSGTDKGKTTVTDTPGVTVTSETDGTRTVTEADALNAEQYEKVLRSLKDPYVAYTQEFEGLFVNYFDMYGGCCGCQ